MNSKFWKESTTTFPSGRYLEHCHSLRTLDGEQYNNNKKDSGERMSTLQQKITTIVIINASPLERWL